MTYSKYLHERLREMVKPEFAWCAPKGFGVNQVRDLLDENDRL